MIAFDGVSAGYGGTQIIQGLDLRIAAGERVALLGPSGAGKTTVLRLCAAALAPQAGRCSIAGVALAGDAPAPRSLRSAIAIIHQRQDLVARSSVVRNVMAGRLGRWSAWQTLRTWCWPAQRDIAEVHAVLQRVELGECLWQRCDRLSGGQQQRVAIARALYQDARLILADEPVSSLDPTRSAAVLDLLCRTASEDGRTLVASLHQPDLARRWFPRLIGLREGRVQFDLPSEAVDDARLAALFADGP